ncbi:MAG: CRISPR-associated ring nuclease Csm6 [Candidatus Binatia bacterium]
MATTPSDRTLFFFVSGRTPQIITETLYFFVGQHRPAIHPDEIHVLTTSEGKELICQRLLTPRSGQFFRFCRDYQLDVTTIRFSEETVDVLRDAHGSPLSDIRTDADNAAAADHILAKVRALTADTGCRLYASMAGGRKTMGLYLGLALQFYGRPQDRLTHVLVSPPVLENHPDFFYLPRRRVSFSTPHGPISSRAATVTVAEVPIVLLGHKLPVLRERSDLTYAALVAQSQQEVDVLTTLAPLTIDQTRRQLCIGQACVPLTGLEFALYSFTARKKLQAQCAPDCAGCEECTVQAADFLSLDTIATLEAIAADGGTRDPRLQQLRWWAKEDEEGKKRFLQVCARIKAKVRRVLGDASSPYVVARLGPRRGHAARYTISLRKPLIQFAALATLPAQ